MTMAKQRTQKELLLPRMSIRLLIIAVTAITLGVLAYIIVTSPASDSVLRGSPAFEDHNSDLGIGHVVTKDQVVAALGSVGKDIKDVSVSNVLNLGDNLGQTATYNFTLPSGAKAFIDVDIMRYASKDAFEAAGVLNGAGKLSEINGRQVYYFPSLVLEGNRKYTLVFTSNNDVYTFSFSQPTTKIEVQEFKAHDILAELIKNASLL